VPSGKRISRAVRNRRGKKRGRIPGVNSIRRVGSAAANAGGAVRRNTNPTDPYIRDRNGNKIYVGRRGK